MAGISTLSRDPRVQNSELPKVHGAAVRANDC